MSRSNLYFNILFAAIIVSGLVGCRGFQYGHLVRGDKPDMVGSHEAGSAVYKPLVEESVAKLLGSCEAQLPPASFGPDGLTAPQRICFVGVENCSAEELGDFREHLYELIDARISQAPAFEPLSRRIVDAALLETRLRPDSLVIPDNMRLFAGILQQSGPPVDYILFAKLTSGTTNRNASTQRDYLLTLELVDPITLTSHKEQAEIRKGYHKSPMGRFASYNIFPGTR